VQADIAAQLAKGIQVDLQPAQRGRNLSMMFQVAAMVLVATRARSAPYSSACYIEAVAATLKRRPRVFFEEWYDPHIRDCLRPS
jgi:iron complex transport system substrate-binding protein